MRRTTPTVNPTNKRITFMRRKNPTAQHSGRNAYYCAYNVDGKPYQQTHHIHAPYNVDDAKYLRVSITA